MKEITINKKENIMDILAQVSKQMKKVDALSKSLVWYESFICKHNRIDASIEAKMVADELAHELEELRKIL